jgi:hypothetical protein
MKQGYQPSSTLQSDYGPHNPGPGRTHTDPLISPSFYRRDRICNGSSGERCGKSARALRTSSSHHAYRFQLRVQIIFISTHPTVGNINVHLKGYIYIDKEWST